MKIAFYMNCVSTHQLPLARAVAALVGTSNFRYVHAGEAGQAYQMARGEVGVDVLEDRSAEGRDWLETADVVLIGGIRPIDLMERRAAKGLKTFYQSERWFKPRLGRLRLLVPSYRRMVKRFVKVVNENDCVKFLAIGPWAKRDFLRMGVRAEKIVDWGYFVEPSRFGGFGTQVPAAHAELDEACVPTPLPAAGRHDCVSSCCDPRVLKVLWAGRDIPLKHVKDIERAVALANAKIVVDESCSCRMDGREPITFTKLTGVTPAEVRAAMREHDVFVMASNGYEGWGAVVSEALEEGMDVVGTWECGACPTLLPKERLYHCGDVQALAKLLMLEVKSLGEGEGRSLLPPCRVGEWTAKRAAERLVALVRQG